MANAKCTDCGCPHEVSPGTGRCRDCEFDIGLERLRRDLEDLETMLASSVDSSFRRDSYARLRKTSREFKELSRTRGLLADSRREVFRHGR